MKNVTTGFTAFTSALVNMGEMSQREDNRVWLTSIDRGEKGGISIKSVCRRNKLMGVHSWKLQQETPHRLTPAEHCGHIGFKDYIYYGAVAYQLHSLLYCSFRDTLRGTSWAHW